MPDDERERGTESQPGALSPPGSHLAEMDLDIRVGHVAAVAAMREALRALERLDGFVEARAESNRGQLKELDDREYYAKKALRELAFVRDRCSNAVRAISVWAEKPNTGLSTHELGRLAGTSNSTIARWQKAPYGSFGD
jgi:hypothetical protein